MEHLHSKPPTHPGWGSIQMEKLVGGGEEQLSHAPDDLCRHGEKGRDINGYTKLYARPDDLSPTPNWASRSLFDEG